MQAACGPRVGWGAAFSRLFVRGVGPGIEGVQNDGPLYRGAAAAPGKGVRLGF